MKKTNKLIALSLLVGLSVNTLGVSSSYAEEKIDFGLDTKNFESMSISAGLNQDASNRDQALAAFRNLRAKMWDENVAYTLDTSNPSNMKIRDFLKTQGINSKDEYLNYLSWSTDHEKLSIQRSYEIYAKGLSHLRPDGSSYLTAVLPNGSNIAAEIIAWNTGDMTPQMAVNQWSYAPLERYNNKSEYELLKESNGVYNNGNGHLHIILDPSFKTVGLAIAKNPGDNYAVADFGLDARSGANPTNLVGRYAINFGNVKEESKEVKKEVDKKDQKERLQAAIDRNKKTIDAAEFLIKRYPYTIKDVKSDLIKLIEKSKGLIKTAKEMIKTL